MGISKMSGTAQGLHYGQLRRVVRHVEDDLGDRRLQHLGTIDDVLTEGMG
jgi:hypothetical protein